MISIRYMPAHEYKHTLSAAAAEYPAAALLDHSGAAYTIVQAFMRDPQCTEFDTSNALEHAFRLMREHLTLIAEAEAAQ